MKTFSFFFNCEFLILVSGEKKKKKDVNSKIQRAEDNQKYFKIFLMIFQTSVLILQTLLMIISTELNLIGKRDIHIRLNSLWQ